MAKKGKKLKSLLPTVIKLVKCALYAEAWEQFLLFKWLSKIITGKKTFYTISKGL